MTKLFTILFTNWIYVAILIPILIPTLYLILGYTMVEQNQHWSHDMPFSKLLWHLCAV